MKISINLHRASCPYSQWFYYLIPKRLTLKEKPAIYKWCFWVISRPENEPNEVFLDEYFVQATSDLEHKRQERSARLVILKKRRTYFRYFDGRQRYGISFKEFNRKVDLGLWQGWLEDWLS
jgi:hypothetical protein